MTPAQAAYHSLPDDSRQEFRLPALLKEHITRAAAQVGQTISEYINAALAERVSHDLAATVVWNLTVPEQEELLRILASATGPTEHMKAAAARADALFGPMT